MLPARRPTLILAVRQMTKRFRDLKLRQDIVRPGLILARQRGYTPHLFSGQQAFFEMVKWIIPSTYLLMTKNRTMPRLLILSMLTLLHGAAKSQNLVPNPSFELSNSCPSNNIFTAANWFNPNSASPDYFNPC